MNLKPLRDIRAAFRLVRTCLHLLWGAATVAVVYPWLSASPRLVLKGRWSRQLLGILGLRLAAPLQPPLVGLVVANHISFLDIFVINALAPASFVSKDDVRSWPLIGWLCRHTDTIFLTRDSRSAAQAMREALASHLTQGRLTALFPEGTTTEGDKVLPFHGALLQSAVDAGAPVTPVLLRYTDAAGQPSRAAAYVGTTSLLECLWSIASCAGLVAQVDVLETIPSGGKDRRQLSALAHRAITRRLQTRLAAPVNPSPSASPAGRTDTGIRAGLPDAPPSIDLPTGIPSPVPADSLPA
ncbi:MAG: 1-acyl-sn-glycerol-3-phosphate acyltransferase [Deltaproteobacteria bacterium]|nr:1-acyl-sn-glycerol-3-phosphate acyltransferase [Deltaproteobacteria bacterium]